MLPDKTSHVCVCGPIEGSPFISLVRSRHGFVALSVGGQIGKDTRNMLVLSRHAEETVVFPGLGINIQILRCSQRNVRIGIEAPREIEVLRGEIAETRDAVIPLNPGHSQSHPAPLAALQTTLHHAAESLNQIHALAEASSSLHFEPEILKLFGHLKKLDTEIIALSGPTRQRQAPPKNAANHSNQPVRALLVDDNDNESKLLSSYLRIKGIEVITASDGQVAMERMSRQPVDIVLLDMSMPRFDGRWTIDQIRHDDRLGCLPVLAVSGTDQADSGVVVGPTGVNGWFRKPLNPDDLILEITNSCRHEQAVLN